MLYHEKNEKIKKIVIWKSILRKIKQIRNITTIKTKRCLLSITRPSKGVENNGTAHVECCVLMCLK